MTKMHHSLFYKVLLNSSKILTGALLICNAPFVFADFFGASTTVTVLTTTPPKGDYTGQVRNAYCQLPLTIEIRCPVETTITGVRVPMTQLYSGAVNNTYVYLSVNGGASTSPTVAGIDGAFGSGNNSYYPMYWDTSFTCSPTASTTLYFHEMTTGTVMAFSPNSNVYSNGLGKWLSTQCLSYATNTRYIDISFFASSTCTSDGGTMCDMASTTEAIYTVGYSLQLYLGIVLLLIFGVMSYTFTRRYV